MQISVNEQNGRKNPCPYLALERADELTVLREDGQVEVVVIVRDRDLSRSVDPHSDRIVGDPFTK